MRMPQFGFMSQLQRQLEGLKPDVFHRVNRSGGFEVSDILESVGRPKSHDVYDQYPPGPTDIVDIGDVSAMAELGRRSLEAGTVGVVRPVGPSTWEFTHAGVSHTVHGYESLRLTPDNQLEMTGDDPSYYPCGTGDIIPALINSGELALFLTAGGRHITIALDRIQPELVGLHVSGDVPVTCGVESRRLDHESVVCSHEGFNQLVHRCRLVDEISDDITWGWNGSMVVDALLDFRNIEWKWHRRKHAVGGRLLVEHERHIDDVTAAFRTQFVRSE